MKSLIVREGTNVLQVHRSERADALVRPLAAVLAEPPADPLAGEIVSVPTRGVERWLAQRLSHYLGAIDGEAGICANIDFDPPGRLVRIVLAEVLGVPEQDDPWRADRLTWPLLALIDDCAGEPWCRPIGAHLGRYGDPTGTRKGRRLAVAQRLARLFAGYAAQRPALLLDWLGGRDEDGAGAPLPADLGWQAELWRRLRERLATPSPAERLADALELCRRAPEQLALPPRLSVFGATRLPAQHLQILHALSEHRDVHLFLPHPSPELWRAVATLPDAPRRRRDVPVVARSALLASMARDITELQLRLRALGSADDRHHPADDPPRSVLGVLQQRLRADDIDAPPVVVPADDRSVEIHACHGRARQVEVLRELLVGLFADHPDLEPRDVIVLCPDIEAFAPLVAATFGSAETDTAERDPGELHPGQTLRVRLADRALRRTNPHLALLATLLELADGRVSANDILDLAASGPVRARFGFSDEELDRIRGWAIESRVRWGEDAARRARYGLAAIGQGTWAAALDRLLLGVAMAEDGARFVGSALPVDDVDSTGIDLVGRVTELVDRLAAVLARLQGRQLLPAWLDTLTWALDILAAAGSTEAWQEVQARRLLTDVAPAGSDGTELELADVRALLRPALEPRPTRAGFRTGALTVCALEPMRAVPHRVVCLLGIDDGVFPRGSAHAGDDLLLRDPCVGERDRRGEDRQLFLDAICAAEQRLVVLYSGADERTGAERPPAVPVAELLDALDRLGCAPDGAALRKQLLVRQPLQTVDERNFVPGRLRRAGPFSFDTAAHRAAQAARGDRAAPAPLLPSPLPPPQPVDEVELQDLVDLLEHPARWFLRERLGLSLPGEDADVDDRLPIELDGLQRWGIGARMLSACLEGIPPRQAGNAELRRGDLPPRSLGRAVLDDLGRQVVSLADAARPFRNCPAETLDVAVALPAGRRLTGTVPGVYGDVIVRVEYSKLAPKHRLRAWVQLLALAAGRPGQGWRAVTIGRPDSGDADVVRSTLSAPAQPEAHALLGALADLLDPSLCEPLPVPPEPAAVYAARRRSGAAAAEALRAAASVWAEKFDRANGYNIRCWGVASELTAFCGVAEDAQDPTRFGLLSRRIWDPLLAAERLDAPRPA